MIERAALLSLRFARQGLTHPVEQSAYPALFRLLSPVPTVYWCAPGSPPTLPLRAAFDDADWCFRARAARRIVKVRFGGGVSYVAREDLALFASVYRKTTPPLALEQYLLARIEQEGPMTIGQLKELTGMRVKDITPALHKLQEKCLLFEDQCDNEGDRGWYRFQEEFPEVFSTWDRTDVENEAARRDGIRRLLRRFAEAFVWFTADMAKSFYKLPVKDVKAGLDALSEDGALRPADCGQQSGYMRPADAALLEQGGGDAPSGVRLLNRNDPLVRAEESRLKGVYAQKGRDMLYTLQIDGEIGGALLGHFRFGPWEIEDVRVEERFADRREEILAAIGAVFSPRESPVQRFMGQKLL